MTQTDPQIKQSRRILGIVTVFFWASEYCHVPFFTPYLNTLGLTSTVIGFLVGCYGFTQMCIRIPLGIFADVKSKYRLIVIGGCFFTTVSSLGLYLTQNVPLMFFFRVLAGVAASTWVGFTVMFSGYYPADQGVVAMANINACNNTGKLLAFVLGSVTATLFGYQIPLLMSCITGVIAVCLSLFIKDVKVTRTPVQFKALLGTFRETGVILPAGLAIVQQMMGPLVEAMAKLLENNTAALHQLSAAQQVQNDRLEALERQIRLNTPVTRQQARYLSAAMKEHALELLDKSSISDPQAIRKLAGIIKKDVLSNYGITALAEIPKHEYNVAMHFVKTWNNMRIVREVVKEARKREEEVADAALADAEPDAGENGL